MHTVSKICGDWHLVYQHKIDTTATLGFVTLALIELRNYNLKEGNPSWELSILIDFGVLEYWSNGVMAKGLMSFFLNTPIFHHSSTPRSRLSRTSGKLEITFLLVIDPKKIRIRDEVM
jgi:hypothetical protein